jgi:SAM-dependent methyltransferase
VSAGHDARELIYGDLHGEQLERQELHNRVSAHAILPLLFERYKPRSIVDVGCGLGTWLSVASELGVGELAGVEGAWLDRKRARVAPACITTADLEKRFDLGRRFDLAMTLEVAEHLSEDAAEGFIECLTRHADVVLFSAAIPFQGGHHHVNERFPDYWRQIFAARGYVAMDFIRPRIWERSEVLVWLRQNVLVYAREPLTRPGGPFDGLAATGPLGLVHPDMYLERLTVLLKEHQPLINALGAGKTLSAERLPDGRLVIRTGD